jgi:hypothetical protein
MPDQARPLTALRCAALTIWPVGEAWPWRRRDPESRRTAARRNNRWFALLFTILAAGWLIGAAVGLAREQWFYVLFALANVALWGGLALFIYPRSHEQRAAP